jgi:FtsH-binding integral membrane protein
MFTNIITLLIGCGILLLSFSCLSIAGWLTGKRLSRLTSGWIAGNIAALAQQIAAGVLGHFALGILLPAGFPLILLLWVALGGGLGLLGAKLERS